MKQLLNSARVDEGLDQPFASRKKEERKDQRHAGTCNEEKLTEVDSFDQGKIHSPAGCAPDWSH